FLPRLKRLTQALQEGQSAIQQISETFYQAEEMGGGVFNELLGEPHVFSKEISEGVTFNGMRRIEGTLSIQGEEDDRAFHPSDPNQGSLANCYFVASLAVIADQNPGLIQRNIRDNGDGTYTVTLYVKREILGNDVSHILGYQAIEVVVTPEFPTGIREDGTSVTPHMDINDTNGTSSELWPLLYEKAYAQHLGDGNIVEGYRILGNGGSMTTALTLLTGQPGSYNAPEYFTLEQLSEMHENGYAMGFLTPVFDEGLAPELYQNGVLVEWHAYYVSDVDSANGTVTLRNPWDYDLPPIVVPYDELGENFAGISVNPITADNADN
ncbi:MAG: C2 family cysteine protease, partial [Anaerolineae bacterium]|nr:C2 family cysteine protease [Anaerolineae bacterium]